MDKLKSAYSTNQPPLADEKKRKEGCLVGAAILGMIILALAGVMALVIYMRPAGLLRYGIVASISNMEVRLESEHTLPDEQYEELKIYLRSLKDYVVNNPIDKKLVIQVTPVRETFRAALRDGQIGRSEMEAIRAAVWKSNIPLQAPVGKQQSPSSGANSPPR
ncbi:hypothetical protein JW933_07885 [candidate division FCPU426 bacterium]|nr:hypothetical protein [candidate division FCPU426 bacterium]